MTRIIKLAAPLTTSVTTRWHRAQHAQPPQPQLTLALRTSHILQLPTGQAVLITFSRGTALLAPAKVDTRSTESTDVSVILPQTIRAEPVPVLSRLPTTPGTQTLFAQPRSIPSHTLGNGVQALTTLRPPFLHRLGAPRGHAQPRPLPRFPLC